MTNKSTKKALLLSVLSMLLCVAMLVGTTFAWFTDSVTSGRNTIKAGNLDVVLEYWDGDSYEAVDENTKLFDDEALWEPGYTEVAYLKVSNAGSLALKYYLAVNVFNETLGKTKAGEDIKLSDYLQFKVVESDTDLAGAYATREAAQAANATATKLQTYSSDVKALENTGDTDYVALIIYMPTTVGNEANHNGTDVPQIDLGINVFATQLEAEEDSFGKDYDKDAEYDSNAVVNGNATESTKLSTENTQVEIPAGAEGGTYVLETTEIKTETDANGVVTATMDITLLRNGEKATTTAEPFKVIVNIGAGLNLTKVLHNNVEITDYTYDVATGDLTFKTTHFSPFAFVYDTVGATVTTAEELKEALKNGGLITLGADITSSEKFVVTKSTVINGNGKTITYTGGDRAIDVPDNAKVNVALENLTVNCAASYCQRGVNYNNGGALVLNNVTVKGTNVTYALNLPGFSDNCEVTITDSSLTGNIAMNIWGANSKITATNTIFTSVDNTTAEGYAAISLNNDGAGNAATGAVVNINGGKIIAKNEKGEASTAVRVETVATVNVSEETEVIGSVLRDVVIVTYEGYNEFYSFDNLQEAIDKAAENANATVKLLDNIVLTESVEIPKGYTVTIDLNGKNIGTSGSTKGCPLYLKGGKLTIKNGILDLDGSGTSEHGTFATAIGYDAYSELVVENVTFTGQTAINGTFATNGPLTITVSDSTINTTNVGIAVAGESPDAIATVNNCNINAGKYAIFASQGAKITINGGTYKSAENVITSMYEGSVVTVNGGSFEGNLLITAKGALVVKGGTFSVDPTAYLASGYVATESNGIWTVTAN